MVLDEERPRFPFLTDPTEPSGGSFLERRVHRVLGIPDVELRRAKLLVLRHQSAFTYLPLERDLSLSTDLLDLFRPLQLGRSTCLYPLVAAIDFRRVFNAHHIQLLFWFRSS